MGDSGFGVITLIRIMEPRARVELATCRLRIGCSTTELPRLRTENYISIRGKLLSIYQRIGRSFSRSQMTAKCLRGSQRENGYMAQPIPIPNSRKSSSDHAIYFTRSIGRRRLKKPNAMDIRSANSSQKSCAVIAVGTRNVRSANFNVFREPIKTSCAQIGEISQRSECVSPFRTKQIAAHPRAHDDQHSYYDKKR